VIDVDPSSPVPLYRQIADQVCRLVAMGALKAGDRIPTVRELAVRTRVNRNTAARAIQHLESRGVVRTRVGQGTFIVESAAAPDAADAGVDSLIDRLFEEAAAKGIPRRALARRLVERIGPGGDDHGKEEERHD
jgi:GntR family transcriptional regulator